ncbi:transmembrane protein 223 [Strongylocentrotus purpuratus]|uniref:Transmembrane protein 223 n=1 Tax=Strongylocentrotus purpuratus TaxID=7668 RepID=A0A7M7T593_STRPU|nr:transmembrane protein 223 [Strongylocentrotus purpuratus]XP_030854822.1 transmembrane protein 223 [Strongylocentrotus purpuratus]
MFSAALLSSTRLCNPVTKVWTCHIWRHSLTWAPNTSGFSTTCLRVPMTARLNSLALRNHRLPWDRDDVGRMFLPCLRSCSRYSKTEVTKDILLYKSDKTAFFRMLGAFACAQVFFWSYLTHTAFLTMKDTDTYVKVKYGEEGPPKEVKNWKSWSGIRVQLSTRIWRYTITGLSLGAGSIIFIASLVYSRRSIYRIVLRKGGESVTIQTYGLFGLPWRFTTSINNTSCEHARDGIRTQLPIKVKGHRLFYILDKEGKFYNARLFDYSIGMHRMF